MSRFNLKPWMNDEAVRRYLAGNYYAPRGRNMVEWSVERNWQTLDSLEQFRIRNETATTE